MSSKRRIQSSRAYGTLSRGRRTEAGERRSSQNAVSHGLPARCEPLEGESAEALQELAGSHITRFGPADEVELGLLDEMAAARWRLRRLWAIESETFEREISAQEAESESARLAGAFASLALGPALALIQRCETRLHRI